MVLGCSPVDCAGDQHNGSCDLCLTGNPRSSGEGVSQVTQRPYFYKIRALLVAVVLSAPVAWWALDRTPAYKMVHANPMPNPARAGDKIDLQWEIVTLRKGCEGTFIRTITDANGWTWTTVRMQSTFNNFELGTEKTHSVVPFILPNVAEGIATIRSIPTFICNPLHRLWPVTEVSPPVSLMVVK